MSYNLTLNSQITPKSNMADLYDVLPIAVNPGGIVDKENMVVKPFVGVYFPAELLDKMKWSKDTRLTLSVEKDGVKIFQSAADREDYFTTTRGLTYEPIDEEL